MGKYFWGDDKVDFKMLGAALMGTAPIMYTILFVIHGGTDDWVDDNNFGGQSRSDYKGLIWCTVLFLAGHIMYNVTPVNISFFMNDAHKDAKYVASRLPGNLQEWNVIALAIFWLFGVFFNARLAAYLAGGWVFSRFITYWLFYGYYAEFTFLLEHSTQCQYTVYRYMLFHMILDLFGTNFTKDVCDASPFLMLPVLMGINFLFAATVEGAFSLAIIKYLDVRAKACKSEENAGGEETTQED